ncbi:amino acid ABC transporter substrate-binding protein, partial [cyanobacterium TDX16]
MMKSRLWRLLALFAVSALFVAACSDDDDSGDGDSSTEDSTTDDSAGDAAAQNEGDGTFQVGTLLPETGSLAFLGPPEFAGVGLAVEEINEAGGVNGEEIPDYLRGDSGDTETDIANQTTDRLLNDGADVIVGAASSGVSLTVIDKITGAGVIQFSPANTAPDFTDYDDNGLYFRTAPSDVLQGALLGDLIAEDGNTTLGILALQDPYGEGL